jgi:hypothetical protein
MLQDRNKRYTSPRMFNMSACLKLRMCKEQDPGNAKNERPVLERARSDFAMFMACCVYA